MLDCNNSIRGCAGLNWRKLAPVPILALVTEYCELPDEQVVVLFQILAAEINFGYKFQTVRYSAQEHKSGHAVSVYLLCNRR